MSDWLKELGSRTPAPGGGAVTGVNAALAAAMLKMVCEYSNNKEAELSSLDKSVSAGLNESDNDRQAFLKLREAYKLSKDTPEQTAARDRAVQTALGGAVQPQINVIGQVYEILETAQKLLEDSNPNLVSDIGVGAASAKSALESAILNIEINLKEIRDGQLASELRNRVEQAENLVTVADSITKTVRQRINGRSSGDA